MISDAMDKRGLGPLITTLSHMGGWPMIMELDEWNEQEYSWQKVDDHYMRLTGENTFHTVNMEEQVGKNGPIMTACVSIIIYDIRICLKFGSLLHMFYMRLILRRGIYLR